MSCFSPQVQIGTPAPAGTNYDYSWTCTLTSAIFDNHFIAQPTVYFNDYYTYPQAKFTLTVTNPTTSCIKTDIMYSYAYQCRLAQQDMYSLPSEAVSEVRNISVFPNPANHFLNIESILFNNDRGVVEIFNVLGERVMSFELTPEKNKYTVSTNNLESGVYLYKFTLNKVVLKQEKLLVIQ